MKPLFKLLLPIILGCIAGFLNYKALAVKGTPTEYVRTKTRLIAGVDQFSNANLEKVLVYGDVNVQGVLWKDVAALYGTPVPRSLEKGDMVLLRDMALANADLELQEGETALLVSLRRVEMEPALLRVGREVGFVVEVKPEPIPVDPENGGIPTVVVTKPRTRVLGPFRIVSVGKTITAMPNASPEQQDPKALSKEITVAAKLGEDRLLSEEATLLANASDFNEILAVTMYPYALDQAEPATEETGQN